MIECEVVTMETREKIAAAIYERNAVKSRAAGATWLGPWADEDDHMKAEFLADADAVLAALGPLERACDSVRCDRCGGSGVVTCECEGERCLCRNHGERSCTGCEGTGHFVPRAVLVLR